MMHDDTEVTTHCVARDSLKAVEVGACEGEAREQVAEVLKKVPACVLLKRNQNVCWIQGRSRRL